MNSRAAQELLDLIMLDDFVARKRALDRWSMRWVSTLELEAPHEVRPGAQLTWSPETVRRVRKQALIDRALEGLVVAKIPVIKWEEGEKSTKMRMHVVTQEPMFTTDACVVCGQEIKKCPTGGHCNETTTIA